MFPDSRCSIFLNSTESLQFIASGSRRWWCSSLNFYCGCTGCERHSHTHTHKDKNIALVYTLYSAEFLFLWVPLCFLKEQQIFLVILYIRYTFRSMIIYMIYNEKNHCYCSCFPRGILVQIK